MGILKLWARRFTAKRSTTTVLHPVDAGLILAPLPQFLKAYWRSINVAVAYGYEYRGMASGLATFYKSKPDLELQFYFASLNENPCQGVAIAQAPFGPLLNGISDEQRQVLAPDFSDGPLTSRFPFFDLEEAEVATLRCIDFHTRAERFLRGESSSVRGGHSHE